ncbi:YbaB/EbfC family nucleoid-associated protein [Mumia sp. Pv 4-285]|uniref:YbaB/EbfC family nucleoid-associated protein n=1 Tax=Mumia qirimensis TaxID=3234852 RepID=UPI00351D0077
MPDMSALLEQAQKMQEQLLAAKEELGRARVTGQAANGLVQATVSGTGELISVEIKPEAVDPDDAELLGDMVVAAVRDANDQAEQLAADKLGPFASGFGGGGDALGGGGAGALGF